METLKFKIEYKNHNEVKLTNKAGNTFTFNPQKEVGFQDFIAGCEIIKNDNPDSKSCDGCGNKTFIHRHSNWIECTSCSKIKILN